MNYHNYKKVPDYKVKEWIESSIVGITPYQKQKLSDHEIVRFAPFEFYERRKVVDSFWVRLSVIFIPVAWVFMFVLLPFNFLFTGRWGYEYSKVKWFDAWVSAAGL